MRTAQAGTLESMDCVVTVTEREEGAGTLVSVTGSSSVRFKTAIREKTGEVLTALGERDLSVDIQDNGAIDLVLAARVEAAVKRLRGGAVS